MSARSIAKRGLGVCFLLGMIELFFVRRRNGYVFFSYARGSSGDARMQVQRTILHVLSKFVALR